MTVSTRSAAKALCEASCWKVSHLELQKLLYLAHMLHLGERGEPLIEGSFEAWDYGPVEPELYQAAKIFGRDPVKDVFFAAEAVPEASPEGDTLARTVEQLRGASPGQLVALTHWEKGAWAKHYRPGRRNSPIPNEDIRQEYMDRLNAVRQRGSL